MLSSCLRAQNEFCWMCSAHRNPAVFWSCCTYYWSQWATFIAVLFLCLSTRGQQRAVIWRCKSWTLRSASLAPQIVVVAQCGFCRLVRIILLIKPHTGKCMEHWSCWLTFFSFLWPLVILGLGFIKELQVQNSPQMTCALMLRSFSGQWQQADETWLKQSV